MKTRIKNGASKMAIERSAPKAFGGKPVSPESVRGEAGQRSAVGARPSTLNSRPSERGIALVITLGVLTVILLIAVGFALSARTEAKSGSSYSMLVSAETYAKMGIDRVVMESLSQPTPYSGNTTFYTSNDLTQSDGTYLNDTNSLPIQGDFIDFNLNGTRDTTEPYWIAVKDPQGKIIGRFAYMVSGDPSGGASSTNSSTFPLDINGIGNTFGAGETFVRTNGYGFIGDTNGNYKIGIAAEVNLGSFLRQLGISNPTNAARRILSYRYGWGGGTTNSPSAVFGPGTEAVDENTIGGTDDPTEYAIPVLGNDGKIQTTGNGVGDFVQNNINSDSSNINLNLYGIAGSDSGDLNTLNSRNQNRINLNTKQTGNTVDVAAVVAVLTNALPTNDVNQLTQWAVNIVDFHTTNLYPTVYTVGTTNFIGIKRTPYFNQARYRHFLHFKTNGANYQLVLTNSNYGLELWNPYPLFPDSVTVIVSNVMSFVSTPALSPISYVATNTWAANTVSNGYVGIAWGNSFHALSAIAGSLIPTNTAMPLAVTVSNYFTFVVYGANPTNIIQYGSGNTFTTNLIVRNVPTIVSPTDRFFLNAEADDPRIAYLFPQSTDPNPVGALAWYSYQGGGSTYNPDLPSRGTNIYTCVPNTSPREGTNSFYVKAANYVSIGEIGDVYRGEPLRGSNAVGAWQTIRLQPSGEGAVLDYVRVNELSGVRGRVNLNASTNGPLGSYQSPQFFALFEGLTNTYAGNYGPDATKITNIIAELGRYRTTLTNFSGSTTNIGFYNIGQICAITNLIYKTAVDDIQSTNDAGREFIIRNIANLITTQPGTSGEFIAWGQAFQGSKPSGIIVIRASIDPSGNRIKLTKFRTITQ